MVRSRIGSDHGRPASTSTSPSRWTPRSWSSSSPAFPPACRAAAEPPSAAVVARLAIVDRAGGAADHGPEERALLAAHHGPQAGPAHRGPADDHRAVAAGAGVTAPRRRLAIDDAVAVDHARPFGSGHGRNGVGS